MKTIGVLMRGAIFWSLVTHAVSQSTLLPTTSPPVPREFPNFNQNYTFVDNSSIRETLAGHVDTEVGDLLKKKNVDEPIKNDDEPEVVPTQEIQEVPKVDHEPLNPKKDQENLGINNVVEWIEPEDDVHTEDGQTTVETVETTKAPVSTDKPKDVTSSISTKIASTETPIATESTFDSSEPYKDGVPVIDGAVAGIMIGVFLIICIVGYTILILWRRALDRKYGSREMLVTDDMFDPDDIKHFSI